MSEVNDDNRWTLPIVADSDGELMVQFNDEIMEQLGLKTGDSIKWVDMGNGTWSIEKVDKEDE